MTDVLARTSWRICAGRRVCSIGAPLLAGDNRQAGSGTRASARMPAASTSAGMAGSIAFGHHALAPTRRRLLRRWPQSGGGRDEIIKRESGVVGAKSGRPYRQRDFASQRSVPCDLAVGRDRQVCSVKLGPQLVGLPRAFPLVGAIPYINSSRAFIAFVLLLLTFGPRVKR